MDKAENKTKFIIDKEFFCLPENRFLSKLKTRNFLFENQQIELKTPCLFVCFNISKFDKFLISQTILSKFVFLNDETRISLFNGSLSKTKYSKLLNSIQGLFENGYSVVLINGQFPSIFGNNQKFTESTVQFLFDTNLDIRFLTFPGEYFADPVWSSNIRRCKTFSVQQLTVSHRMMLGYSQKELFDAINDVVPSTATIYSYKYLTAIRSNSRATNLETILYCCPKCKSFFTLYSEFSCIKCKNCSAAIELAPDGSILFSKDIKNFDQVESFLYDCLTTKGFDTNPLISYENIIVKNSVNDKQKSCLQSKIEIFADKFVFVNPENKKETTYLFDDVENINLTFDNTLVISLPKNKNLIIQGANKENLYIMKDLLKINKN